MAKGRNSTGFGIRMQDDLLVVVENLARSRGLTRNELIVELVRLGLDTRGEEAPSTMTVQPKPIAVGVVGGKPSAKAVTVGPITRIVKVKGVRKE